MDVVRGPKLHDKIASLVDQKWLSRLSREDILSFGEISIPENVEAILTPTVNKEVWGSLHKDQRKLELRNIRLQENLQRAALTSASTIDFLLKMEKSSRTGDCPKDSTYKDLMTQHMNVVALLGNVSHHFSYTRRQRLKFQISPKISGICDLEFPGPQKQLFGDDFAATLARAEQKRKVAETVTKRPVSSTSQQDFRQGRQKKRPPYTSQRGQNHWQRPRGGAPRHRASKPFRK